MSHLMITNNKDTIVHGLYFSFIDFKAEKYLFPSWNIYRYGTVQDTKAFNEIYIWVRIYFNTTYEDNYKRI